MNKLVSIIIPAYNVENYIFRAIESSINQTYPNIEIVIIDDGSTDKTWDIIREYSQKYTSIRAFKQDNKGVSAARNNALSHCNGEYVVFLDSDDWLEANAVQELLDRSVVAKERLICCDRFFAFINEDGDIIKEPQCQKKADESVDKNEVLITEGNGQYNIQSSCYKLFSLKQIREHNLCFSESIYYGEDGLFVFQYLQFCPGIIFIYEPLWNILERPGSATTGNYSSKLLTILKAIDCMIDLSSGNSRLIDSLIAYKRIALLMILSAYLNYPFPVDDYFKIKDEMSLYIKENKVFDVKLFMFVMLPRRILCCIRGIYLKAKRLKKSVQGAI